MSIRKKVLSVTLAIITCFSCINVYANEPDGKVIYEKSITINEFDLIESQSDYEDVVDTIEDIALQNDTSLQREGYTSEQIENLRTYIDEPTNDNLSRLGATLTANFKFIEDGVDESDSMLLGDVSGGVDGDYIIAGKYFLVYVDWEWNGKPFWQVPSISSDIIAIGWAGLDDAGHSVALEFQKEKSRITVEYIDAMGVMSERVDQPIVVENAWAGIYSTWKPEHMSSNKFGKKRDAVIRLKSVGSEPVNRFNIGIKYGHDAGFSPSASFNIGPFGSVGISLDATDTLWTDSFVFDKYARPQ